MDTEGEYSEFQNREKKGRKKEEKRIRVVIAYLAYQKKIEVRKKEDMPDTSNMQDNHDVRDKWLNANKRLSARYASIKPVSGFAYL